MRVGLEPDSVLAGYRIVEVLGSGGMGVVYRAEQPSLDRDVALKVIAAPLVQDERFRRRFERESRIAASIAHPHVLPVYEAGDHDGLMFIAMQFVEGGDLGRLISARDRLEADLAVGLVSQVAAALDAAHARGLVHRDVKPANVLLSERDGEWHAYLADFGLSAREGSNTGLTATGGWVGTPDYIAPEQIDSSRVDGRADVYALGCLLFKALTGEPPFPRESDVATMWAHIRDEPTPVSAIDGVPSALDAVVARAMRKAPEERYQSAGELAEQAVIAADVALPHGGRATAAAPPFRTGSTTVPARRHRRGAAIAAGTLLALAATAVAVLVGLGAFRSERSRTPRVVGSIVVKGTPDRIAVGDGSVWVSVDDDQRPNLTKIDPLHDRVVRSLPVSGRPYGVAVGKTDGVWVGIMNRNTVLHVKPHTGSVDRNTVLRLQPGSQLSTRAGLHPQGMSLGSRSLWVANRYSSTVSRLDRAKPRAAPSAFDVGLQPMDVFAGGDAVWVTNFGDGTISRLNQRTGRRIGTDLPVGHYPWGIVEAFGYVWVANWKDDTVSRLRLRPGGRGVPERKDIHVGHAPREIAAGENSVWVVNYGDESVSRIDPREGKVAGPAIRVGRAPNGIAVFGGAVWVANRLGRSITKIKP